MIALLLALLLAVPARAQDAPFHVLDLETPHDARAINQNFREHSREIKKRGGLYADNTWSGVQSFDDPAFTVNGSSAAFPPPGSVLAYGGSSAPAGWLECNGSTISRTTYAGLYAAIGDNFGDGDGSTTFNLPDLRGSFIRGWDNGWGADPDAASRLAYADGGASGDAVGSFQQDEFESHTHSQMSTAATNRGTDATTAGNSLIGNTGATGGNETRPRNVYLMYIIKT